MAKMIPKKELPKGPLFGEDRLYKALEEGLGNEFYVFHNLPYSTRQKGAGIKEGEVDFLIIHRVYGILLIEVKGGVEISYDATKSRWYSTDSSGIKHRIKDPFTQGQESLYTLIEKIKGAGIFGRRLPFAYGHAVAFPDIGYSPQQNLPPHVDRSTIIYRGDLSKKKIQRKVISILESYKRNNKNYREMTNDELNELLNKILMPEYKLARSLSASISDEEEVLKRLTETQCLLLEFIHEHKHALIKGYAGTGKTFLAVEKARRLAADNKKVLLLCYNRRLAHHLRGILKDYDSSIDVYNYHDLVKDFASQAGLIFNPPRDKGEEGIRRFMEESAPLKLLEAIEILGKKYDAILVDEGQDFLPDWYASIKGLLADPENSHFYIFYDPLQDIYARDMGERFPISGDPFLLKYNCRNTKSINKIVSQLGGIKPYSTEFCLPGEPVDTLECENEKHAVSQIVEIVRSLLRKGVSAEQIALISPYRKMNSCLRDVNELCGYPISQGENAAQADTILFSTLHSFKGMESDVVILCDVDGREPACSRTNLYVAASRAKHKLYILHYQGWNKQYRP